MTPPTTPPTTPAEYGEAAAELIRAINHTTRPGAGHLSVTDLYDLLGALALLTGRLPQTLSQVEALIDALVERHHVIVVDGEHTGDPVAVAAVAGHWLQAARTSAARLADATDRAQQALTWAATPGRPDQ
jgi:hypothetical protein